MYHDAHYVVAYQVTNPHVHAEWRTIQKILERFIAPQVLQFPKEPYVEIGLPFTASYKAATVIKLELFTLGLTHKNNTLFYGNLKLFSHRGVETLAFEVISDNPAQATALEEFLKKKKNIRFIETQELANNGPHLTVCEGTGLLANRELIDMIRLYNSRSKEPEKKHTLGEVDVQVYAKYSGGWSVLSYSPEKSKVLTYE
jgi:hypothetical protein